MISSDGQFDQVGVEMNGMYSPVVEPKPILRNAWLKIRCGLDAAEVRKANTDVEIVFTELKLIRQPYKHVRLQWSHLHWFPSIKAQYDEGLKNMVNTFKKQQNAFQPTEGSSIQYDYVMNVLKLKASVGQLNEDEIRQMNALADP